MGFYYVDAEKVIGGAGRLLYAPDTADFPTKIADVIDTTTYAAMCENGWEDFGFTDGGITITRNVDVTVWDTDQMPEVDQVVDRWTHELSTNIVQQTLAKLKVAWQGGTVQSVTGGLEGERYLPFGAPSTLIRRRMCVIFKDKNGYLWMWAFRYARLSAGGDMSYSRGAMLVTPVTFKLFPDTSIEDEDDRVFRIFTNCPDS